MRNLLRKLFVWVLGPGIIVPVNKTTIVQKHYPKEWDIVDLPPLQPGHIRIIHVPIDMLPRLKAEEMIKECVDSLKKAMGPGDHEVIGVGTRFKEYR